MLKIKEMFLKLYLYSRKFRVALCRIFFGILKVAVYLIGTAAVVAALTWLVMILVYMIESNQVKIVWPLSKDYVDEISKYYCLGYLYQETKVAYVPTILVAGGSMAIAILTIWLSHYTRSQDRVSSFPENILVDVNIGLTVSQNYKEQYKYFDPYKGELFLKFRYAKSFAGYYGAYPYRIFVCLDRNDSLKGHRKEWEAIRILNHQIITAGKKNVNDGEEYIIIIEATHSKLLKDYCKIPSTSDKFKLDLYFDVKWTNYLIPLLSRHFADLFIRDRIRLDTGAKEAVEEDEGAKTTDTVLETSEKQIYRYRCLYSKYSTAHIASWIMLMKCFFSRKGD